MMLIGANLYDDPPEVDFSQQIYSSSWKYAPYLMPTLGQLHKVASCK